MIIKNDDQVTFCEHCQGKGWYEAIKTVLVPSPEDRDVPMPIAEPYQEQCQACKGTGLIILKE